MRKSRDGQGIMPIKSLRAGWRRGTFQTQYPMSNYSWLPWKWKIISAMDTSMKCEKTEMEEWMLIKSLRAGWRIDRLQTHENLIKMKKTSAMGTSMKCVKSRDRGGNNAYKIFMCRVEEKNIICKQSIFFGAVYSYNEKETIFWMDKKVNSMKSKRQDRRVDSVKRKKKERKKMQKPQQQKCIFQQQKIKPY